jgi:tetratricopeptide (TPR) repeat protein
MDNYDYETALALIARQQPTTVPLLFQKAKALRGLNLNSEALEVYEELLGNDSTNVRAWIEAADCQRTLAKYKQALQYYQKALELAPHNKYARIQNIRSLLAIQDYQKALVESTLLTQSDSSLIALRLQAQSLEGLNAIQNAIDCYHNIQAKYPSDYLAPAKLGALNISIRQYDEAIKATEKYRQIDSTNYTVNQQNAQAYCMKQDYPTAIKRYEYLVNQGDSTFATNYYLGVSYYATERFYKAQEYLSEALRYAPENVDLLYYLGRACSKTSWKKEGVEYLRKAVDLSTPADSVMTRLLTGLVDCYKLAHMYKEQIATVRERYEKYDKQNHRSLYTMAHIYYYGLGDKTNAERYFEAFLKTRPKTATNVDEAPSVDENGDPTLSDTNYYNAAEAWLKNLRDKKKVDEFFQSGKKTDAKTDKP